MNRIKTKIKKIAIYGITYVMALSLTACNSKPFFISESKAKEIATDLISENVDYLGSEKITDNEIIYKFENDRNIEFAIISKCVHPNLDGKDFGGYSEDEIYSNYKPAVFRNAYDEIQNILEKYNLLQYAKIDDERNTPFEELSDSNIILNLDKEASDNIKLLEDISSAIAEIDCLLAYEYNYAYEYTEDIDKSAKHKYTGYNDSSSIDVVFGDYDKVAYISFSNNANDRSTKDSVYEEINLQISVPH